MNRWTRIYGGDGVTLGRFDHPCHEVHRDPAKETATSISLNFVESGSFRLEIGRDTWDLDTSRCFVTKPDLAYRSRHLEEFPSDVCLSLEYEETTAEEIYSVVGKLHRRPVVGVSNRSRYLLLRLARSIRSADSGGIEVELLARHLMADAIAPDGRPPYSRTQVEWYSERIEAVRGMIEKDVSSPLTLRSLARAAGMSPYHFARIFSELVGVPPHRYLIVARLRAAAQRLLEGETATRACFDVGFNHLAHFSRMFQREFGCSPSVFRATARPPTGRQLRNPNPDASRY